MSDVVKMIVCDENGQYRGENKGKIFPKGEIISETNDGDIYTFFATKYEKEKDSNVEHKKDIQLTMPVGGDQNGVLRLPRVGEQILVIVQGNEYYLLSYLPNSKNMEFRQNIEEKDEQGNKKTYKEKSFVDDEAFSIRYQSPNPLPESVHSATCGSNIYSELKFSTQETSWPTKVIVSKNSNGKWIDSNNHEYTEKVVKKITDKKGIVSQKDKIDNVQLLSTGDLCTSAGNSNAMEGRRIALFSGDENAITASDIDNLKQGDITGKAGHKIYLEAQDGIVLKCGRSEIRIDDAGITIVSAKIDPDFGIADDSKIFLDPRTGVSIGGSNININANARYTISERCGGNISSFAGMTRICGRDVQVASQNRLDAGITYFSTMWDYGTMGKAINDAYSYKQEKGKKASDIRTYVKDFRNAGRITQNVLKLVSSGIKGVNSHHKILENTSSYWKDSQGILHDANILIKEDYVGADTRVFSTSGRSNLYKEEAGEKKKFIKGAKAVTVSIADLALSIANTLIKTTDLVFASIEKNHEDILANKGSKQGDSHVWTGADLRDRCNKGYYWATQSIIEAVNTACFATDIVEGVIGARLATVLDTSSIRFYGGFGDLTASSVEEKGVQKISAISPLAAKNMAIAGLFSNFVGSGMDVATAGVKASMNGKNDEEELKYL